ncbi:MAG: hypothetical protein Q8M53_12420 [Burkholderiales bacterium]|nr:hypothetical protein [Burkholderiales bacterium]
MQGIKIAVFHYTITCSLQYAAEVRNLVRIGIHNRHDRRRRTCRRGRQQDVGVANQRLRSRKQLRKGQPGR